MTAETNGMFIRVEVDPAAARDTELAKKLVEVCPVNIFGTDASGNATIVESNLDECVLCDLCIQAAPPGAVKVHKLYSGETLER
jgi:NAD-dependent dihydropyrimidine dehydrogenase PreA subunit